MKKFLTGVVIAIASITTGLSAQPAQALTPQEARGIGIGVSALTCALSNGCSNQAGYYGQAGYYNRREIRPYYQQKPVFVVPIVRARSVYSNYDRYENRYDNRSYYPAQSRRRQDISVVINSVYVEVLGRNADYQGLRTYQDRYNSGWSIKEIRNDIARSDEARSRNRYFH